VPRVWDLNRSASRYHRKTSDLTILFICRLAEEIDIIRAVSDGKSLAEHIEREIELAKLSEAENDLLAAFTHLERAHVLGQSLTDKHTRVHWLMLRNGWKRRDAREIFGQVVRIIGAATKTPFGIYPGGNTGGANVYFFKKMPVPADLQEILNSAKTPHSDPQ
jgi:hypothetical protein